MFDNCYDCCYNLVKLMKGYEKKMHRLDKRFGDIAVEKGYITLEQLIEALSTQATENVSKKEHHLIGAILRQKGYMGLTQIDDVLRIMFENKYA